jgi:hypothetical protein
MTQESSNPPGLTPGVVSLADEIARAGSDELMPILHTQTIGDRTLQVRHGRDTLWLILMSKEQGAGEGEDGKKREKDRQRGGFALRTAHAPGIPFRVESSEEADGSLLLRADSVLGEFEVRLQVPDPKVALLRCTVRLTPSENLLLPFLPRDLYPLDAQGNPAGTRGKVHAGQRGFNGGLLYLTLTEPAFGSLLYFQNLTSLNDYFQATGTKPDGVVGGQWPELGYQPPTSPNAKDALDRPLPAGKAVVVSDVFLNVSTQIPEDPRQTARLFVDLLAGIYGQLERPETQYHDWLQKAKETLRDLDESPKATISHYGNRYIHPYTASEYPDSMVQMTVLTPIREYARWKGNEGKTAERAAEFSNELFRGMPRFYDKDLETVRRYLPNVGEDKDADEVDSWYLYHPLINLGRLAKEGDEKARELFLNSLDFSIRAAQHFKYQWPVQYNVRTLDVIKDRRKEGEPGQSDVGGLYAYLMIQAWELTEDKRYLDEAKNALLSTRDMGFEMAYQMNLTGWGVNACVRLWRITQEEFYRDQSLVYIANYLHNCILWESRIDNAEKYRVFFGATCLHDGPYMAIYECFESFAAFEEYLSLGQDDVPDSARLLLTEFYKYTLTRAWYFYPKELPKEVLATEIRNGHIDRKLAFPLEDLYADGQPAGQVGQELYGAGAAFTFVTRAYHRMDKMPFLLYCEYPLSEMEETEERSLTLEVCGADGFDCKMRLIPLQPNQTLPSVNLFLQDQTIAPNRLLQGKVTEDGHCEFVVPANQSLLLKWEQE